MFRIFTFYFSLFFIHFLSAQDNLSVIKNKGIPANANIVNIYIGPDNQIIVADKTDLYRVIGSSQALKLNLPPNTTSLLQFKGGNKEVYLDMNQINNLLQPDEIISTAAINLEDEMLWIGTLNSGLFQINPKEGKILQQFNVKNGKLNSNTINLIKFDENNRIWVATDLGVFIGKAGKFELIEKDFSFQDISINGKSVWLLGDNMVGPLNSKKEWIPIIVPEDKVDGDLKSVGIDGLGNVWLASEIMTQYFVEEDSFVLFGPNRDFTSQFSNFVTSDLDGRIWIGTQDKGIYVIQEKEMLAVGIQVVKPISCNSFKWDGELEVKVNGGLAPFTYKWSADSIKGKTPIGLGPGTYRVTVTSGDGIEQSAEVSLVNTRLKVEPKALTATSAPGNADAQAKVTVSGGTPPYQVSWDNGRTGVAVGGLSGGNHIVTVVDSKECFGTASFEVNENQMAIGVKLEIVSFPDCKNTKGGVLKLVYKGGKEPYKFNWSVPGSDNSTISGLGGGIYAVTISDSEGLSAKAAIELPSPKLMTATGNFTKVASGLGNDGSAVVIVSNAIGKTSYLWDNGQTDSLANNLSGGFHRVTITDEKGCTLVHQVEVPEQVVAVTGEILEEKSLSCSDKSDGSLKIVPKGGKAPFTYLWSNGSKEQSISNLEAGIYTVTLTDEKLQTAVIKKELVSPEPLDLVLQIVKPSSTNNADGVAKILASGGNGEYKISWNKGLITDDITNLADGNYDFMVVDAKGCTLKKSLRMSEVILPLTLDFKVLKEVTCNNYENGILEALPSGGKPPYKYAWNLVGKSNASLENIKSGNYQVTVTDQLGSTVSGNFDLKNPPAIVVDLVVVKLATVNQKDGWATATISGGIGKFSKIWSTNETSDTAFQFGPGYQKLSVTDELGCTFNKPFVMTEDIKDFNLSIEVKSKLNCAGDSNGALSLGINGGKPPYKIKWNMPGLEGAELLNLKKGLYTVSVTDELGKTSSASFNLQEPEPINAGVQVTQIPDLDSLNGKATVQITGGLAPYSILWENGETAADAIYLPSGKQFVSVRDANNCEIKSSFVLDELVPELMVNILTQKEISCFGEKDGNLNLEIIGGKKPFVIKWNNGSSSPNISSLAPGKYSVTITDSKNKMVTAEKILYEPIKLDVTVSATRGASDEISSNGKSFLSISGGSFPFEINWDNGNKEMNAKNLKSGAHSVTVTDNRGCISTSSTVIPIRLIPGLAQDSFKTNQIVQIEKLVFQADSINIPPNVEDLLQEVLQFLKDYPTLNVEFGGHTNNVASDAYADEISLKRAKSVANYFIRNGIPESRVSAFGYGKKNPLVSNDTPEGRKKNQRVEMKILNGL